MCTDRQTHTHTHANKQTPLKTTPALPARMEAQVIIIRLFLQRKIIHPQMRSLQFKHSPLATVCKETGGRGAKICWQIVPHNSTSDRRLMPFIYFTSLIHHRIYIYIFTFPSLCLLLLPTLVNLTDEIIIMICT